MKKRAHLLIVVSVMVIAGLWLAHRLLLRAPEMSRDPVVFIVNRNQTAVQTLDKLEKQGLIRNRQAFAWVLELRGGSDKVVSGGYTVSKNMSAWQLAGRLVAPPDMKWVVIREGLRKEQIGEILAETFGWSDEELDKWNTVYTRMKVEYLEGTYFPDTYLIPVDESGLDIAKRMTRRFDEQFAPYVSQFAEQNILWTTGLKIASIIEREAGGKSDKPIIAGVLWNRLNRGMKLEIDATVQYARGKAEAGWWAPIKAADIDAIDSPYNTYKYQGLPPYPISNPGLDSIEAVLHPTETACLYYLHDSDRQIHCADTYEEHEANIEQYLR